MLPTFVEFIAFSLQWVGWIAPARRSPAGNERSLDAPREAAVGGCGRAGARNRTTAPIPIPRQSCGAHRARDGAPEPPRSMRTRLRARDSRLRRGTGRRDPLAKRAKVRNADAAARWPRPATRRRLA